MTPATRAYMHQFWAAGFMPWPPQRALAILWPLNQLKVLFGNMQNFGALAYAVPELYVALTGVGFWLLWRRRRAVTLLLLAPVAATLAAAIGQQYPFSDRLILFLLPSFFLAIATAVEWVFLQMSLRSHALAWLSFLLLVGPAAYPTMRTPPPYQREHIGPALAHMQANRRPGDALYVFYGAGPAVTFYAKRYGLREEEYAVGGCHRLEGRRYLEELDTFRGQPRVWVVMTHAIPAYHERDNMLGYLDTIGSRRDAFSVPPHLVGDRGLPAELFLYDLSDPVRLDGATATSFPLLGPSAPDARFVCSGGPDAMVPARGV